MGGFSTPTYIITNPYNNVQTPTAEEVIKAGFIDKYKPMKKSKRSKSKERMKSKSRKANR